MAAINPSGPKPMPPEKKKLLGGKTGKHQSKNTPKANPLVNWSAPEDLGDDGARLWEQMADRLKAEGFTKESDHAGLVSMCQAYDDWIHAREILEEEGIIIIETSSKGYDITKAHPAVAIRNDADRRFMAWTDRFGMNPSARSRVERADIPDEEDVAESHFN